jgi:hypothetical protein
MGNWVIWISILAIVISVISIVINLTVIYRRGP